MVTMGSAPSTVNLVDSSDICAAKGIKGSNFLRTPKEINSDLRVLRCKTNSRDINYPNNTLIVEKEGTNDVGSEGGGEN
jgi:hypothetical protein